MPNRKVDVGTVIDFPLGQVWTIEQKLAEAQQAIADGANDLDFVCNYEAFKNGDSRFGQVRNPAMYTRLVSRHHKIVKWIIEVAALNHQQIIQLSSLIKKLVINKFQGRLAYAIGFCEIVDRILQDTENNEPNGATVETIILMLENASPLPVKAAGGVRTFEEAAEMIRLGVKRIGTSGAKTIADGQSIGCSNY